MNVLLVENREAFWSDLYQRLLVTRCTPFAVNSGRDAQRMLALLAFDLVICDQKLQDGDGVGLFRDAFGGVAGPIKILVAQRGGINSISDAVIAGVDDIVEKPFCLSHLIARLSKRLCLSGCSPPQHLWSAFQPQAILPAAVARP